MVGGSASLLSFLSLYLSLSLCLFLQFDSIPVCLHLCDRKRGEKKGADKVRKKREKRIWDWKKKGKEKTARDRTKRNCIRERGRGWRKMRHNDRGSCDVMGTLSRSGTKL